MKAAASLLFASKMIFPRTGKNSNARKSLIGAFLAIGISLVPLVMILSVSNGMIKGITERMVGLSSSHLSCFVSPSEKEMLDAKKLQEIAWKTSEISSVKFAFAELDGIALASGKNGRTGASLRAVSEDIFEENESFKNLLEVVEGEKKFPTAKSAVIGKKLAENLGLKAGDSFRIITTRTLSNGKTLPKITLLKIAGIVSCGYQELDALWVFIPLETGFSILPEGASSAKVGVFVNDPFGMGLDLAQADIEGRTDFFSAIYKWSELNSAEYENFSSTQMMLLVIMLLIVLVASVNISSALVMLVMERRREIAIIKSLGGTSNGIALSFLLTGLATGGAGVLFGLPAGLLSAVNFNKIMALAENVVNILAKCLHLLTHDDLSDFTQIKLLSEAFYLQNIPLDIPLTELIIITAGTLILSLLVSAIPAIKAGREKPVDTLRKI